MNTHLNTIARELRKRLTDAEKTLWNHLRLKQLENLKLRRQQPVDKYIVDFICFEKRLVIEVDGGQHLVEKSKDKQRDQYLRKHGFEILRFWNHEVLMNIEGVLEVIRRSCLEHPPPNPLPSREGE